MPARPQSRDTGTPAAALGPLALALGVVSGAGVWPTLTFTLLPWSLLAGGLAVTFGAMGVYYAGRGIGRLWTSVVGIVLGVIGLADLSVGFLLLGVLGV
ncbi:hypothetical protein SRB17_15780 [Streptomyces sp. RB17]|uniref:hypothetical protein n=1 Tax=Streptomyces sp. RB17 TaxID=2585197 RepID=UPI0012981EB2|nr:hypothetical protein [Streptomyces sp. RB17]MQY33617.1 hypothetical protein [Streptomyces sp. RB17]